MQIEKLSVKFRIMRYLLGFFILAAILGTGSFFILSKNNVLEMSRNGVSVLPGVPEAPIQEPPALPQAQKISDIENQKPLSNPPDVIKAIYFTGWSAGSERRINYLIDIAEKTEINAVVIDIKDFSGYVDYDIQNADVEKYKAKEVKIPRINALIKKLHDAGIYVIARVTVFQDPVLATARPDLAIHSKAKLNLTYAKNQAVEPPIPEVPEQELEKLVASGDEWLASTLWLDHKKLAWVDPASKEVWDYNIAIAKDAASRGFDEINFDYIRFASDGDLNDMIFPFWDGKTLKSHTIKLFFKYLREQLAGLKISADLFGLATVNNDDLGIGQKIESAYAYFDYVCPMVYPSHYAKGFLGYKNPAQYPYEVIKYSMDSALKKLNDYEVSVHGSSSMIYSSKLRPWIQDFDLGANYDAAMVKKEIKAVYDSASSAPAALNGWMLWDPKNIYTRGALEE